MMLRVGEPLQMPAVVVGQDEQQALASQIHGWFGTSAVDRLESGITTISALLLFHSSRPVPTRLDLSPLFEYPT